MFGRVESVLLLLLLFQTRLLLSVNLITSPLRHNLTSLFSFSTVRRESTWQCRLLLIQLHPSLHLPAATHLHADRSSMFLLVSPHGLHPSLLLQRFVWEVVFTSTRLLSSLSSTLILLRCVRLRIVLITHRSSHTADVHLQTVTDVYVLSKEAKQEVLHEKAGKRPDQQDKC